MQPFQIIPTSGTTPPSIFSPRTSASSQLGTSIEAQPVTQSQVASLKWMIENSRLGWAAKVSFREGLNTVRTAGAAHQFQENLLEELELADANERTYLRRGIAETIRDNPDFFSETWYGREEVNCCWRNLTSAETTWLRLHEDYTRLKQAVEVWRKTQDLVEIALVDGEKLQRDMRRAARDSTMTQDDEAIAMRQLVAKLTDSQSKATKYSLCDTMRQLYELVLDSDNPSGLLALLPQAVGSTATN